ncbi:MAG: hypothetical protein ACI81G_001970 [Gammaproteobacteria bacterium]|jgi:hypothetical protein
MGLGQAQPDNIQSRLLLYLLFHFYLLFPHPNTLFPQYVFQKANHGAMFDPRNQHIDP